MEDYSRIEEQPTSVNKENTVSLTAFIPDLSSGKLKYVYRLSKTMRLLSIFDMVLGWFILLFGNEMIGLVAIRLVCGLSGYYGARDYNYCLSLIYLLFLFMGTLCELGLIILLRDFYIKGEIKQNVFYIASFYQIMFFFLKAYLTRFSCIFMSRISDLSKRERGELLEFNKKTIEVVYW